MAGKHPAALADFDPAFGASFKVNIVLRILLIASNLLFLLALTISHYHLNLSWSLTIQSSYKLVTAAYPPILKTDSSTLY